MILSSFLSLDVIWLKKKKKKKRGKCSKAIQSYDLNWDEKG